MFPRSQRCKISQSCNFWCITVCTCGILCMHFNYEHIFFFVRDILLGLMKRLVTIHASNLKVLITSATLDGEKVSKFFSNCPILNVPGKLYPVEILYSNERPTSYVESSLKTALGMIKQLVYSWCNDNVFYTINLCSLFLLFYRFCLVHWHVFLWNICKMVMPGAEPGYLVWGDELI